MDHIPCYVVQLGVDDYTHWIARGRIFFFAMLPQLHLKWKFLVLKPFRQDIDDTFKGRMILLGKQFAQSMRESPIYFPLQKQDEHTCITFLQCTVKTMILNLMGKNSQVHVNQLINIINFN